MRRDLTIQKLRESVVLAEVKVDDKEIDAWLAARTPPGSRRFRERCGRCGSRPTPKRRG